MLHSRPPRDPPPSWNTILNFHFDYPQPSLIIIMRIVVLVVQVFSTVMDADDALMRTCNEKNCPTMNGGPK